MASGTFRCASRPCSALETVAAAVFFILTILPTSTLAIPPSSVLLNTFLPPDGSTDNVVLASPNGMFNLKVETWRDSPDFYCMAGVTNVKINPNSMLWAANYNAQPLLVASSCRLFFSSDGDLLLLYDGNKTAWHTHTARMGASALVLLDSGNLVLQTETGSIIWQSFSESPAFAWNSGMKFTSDITIYAGASIEGGVTDFNIPGSYGMQLHNNSSLVLFTNSNDSASRFVYWSTSYTSSPVPGGLVGYVTLGGDGLTFYDINSSTLGTIAPTIKIPSNYSTALDVALVDPSSANLLAFYRLPHSWDLFYNSSIDACQNPTRCGNFGLCDVSTRTCKCPPGYFPNAQYDCQPEMALSLPSNASSAACPSHAGTSSYIIVSVNVSFAPQLEALTSESIGNCSSLCLNSCTCKAALFDPSTSSCSLFTLLPTLPVNVDSSQVMLLKLQAERSSKKKHMRVMAAALSAALAVSLCSVCALAALCRMKKRRKRLTSKEALDENVVMDGLPRLPPRFTFKEIEEATKAFSTKLGSGGFGSVYEGELPSGQKIAVKKLEESSKQSASQFMVELGSMGSVSHMNLVTLKGFCYEDTARLLVFEHMANGSLERWLFRKEGYTELSWQKRCKIAMDTARGLTYLHDECTERIVHCDVKPENILLDENFNAKVGDFGLAKLLRRDRQSFTMTTLKGTRGYLAPEWLQNANITAKSDVYGYGVVLLELISGRRCLDSDYGYLPTLAFRVAASNGKEVSDSSFPSSDHTSSGGNYSQAGAVAASTSVYDESKMVGLLDERLCEDVSLSRESLERMILVGLWCVQPNPATRPPMRVVVQMLEGVVPVPRPPLQVPSSNYDSSTEISASWSTSQLSSG